MGYAVAGIGKHRGRISMKHIAGAAAALAKGRFSEVVTVRNPGKIIYLGGVGAEDENTDKGGVIRHLGDFDAQCHYAWDKIKRLLAKHGATIENIDKLVTY